MNTQRIPYGNRWKAQGRVESKDWTSTLSRITMLREDSPCLKERGVHGILEKDLDFPVFDPVTVQIVNIRFRFRILSG